MHVVNKTGAALQIKWKRTILNSTFTDYSDRIYDGNGAYFCGNGTTWTNVSSTPVESGDSIFFHPKIYISEIGLALHRYYILDSGNGDAIIDSVDVQFNSTVLSVETSTIDFSVFPNPANSILNISISESNTSISIFDIVGNNVSEMQLVNGTNTLNIDNLNAGVYFYSIKRNGNVIETKKLVIN